MKYVKLLLAIFVAASLIYLVAKNFYGTASTSNPVLNQVQSTEHSDGIVIYYFHGKRRCYTCKTIEQYTNEAIAPYLADKNLIWYSINYEEPKQSHFIKDFSITSSGPVLVEYNDGKTTRWHALTQVWQLVRNKESFINYIKKEVSGFLENIDNG